MIQFLSKQINKKYLVYDINSVKTHIIQTMEIVFDEINYELIDYNLVGILPITELTNKKRFNKRKGTIRSYHIKNQVVGATIMDISDDNIFLSRKFINESKDDMDILDRNNNNLIWLP